MGQMQSQIDHITDVKLNQEQVEYERNEKADEVERLKHDKQALLQEIEELRGGHQNLLRNAALHSSNDGAPGRSDDSGRSGGDHRDDLNTSSSSNRFGSGSDGR